MDRAIRNIALAATLACTMLLIASNSQAQTADSVLQKTRDLYVGLKSYSDTAVVLNEYGTASTDRFTFTTNFNRVPRHFILDFRKPGGGRYVIWGDPDAFHTWTGGTGQQYDYPNPSNATALTMSSVQTYGAAMGITTLLYGKAKLGGLLNNIADPVLDGTEEISGHRCYRIVGRMSDTYAATSKEVNVRKATIWIETDSSLVRQVKEEWKPLPGQRSRLTTTFQPQINPTIDDSKFKFVAPQQ
jgi:outer membrane lipoprotein-sorting protein